LVGAVAFNLAGNPKLSGQELAQLDMAGMAAGRRVTGHGMKESDLRYLSQRRMYQQAMTIFGSTSLLERLTARLMALTEPGDHVVNVIEAKD
jgi:hypothetical protein